jgi:ribose 5-phosphate isomerase RpiB
MSFNFQLPIAIGSDHAGFGYNQKAINYWT